MTQLGAMHAASFEADPKHLGFVLARYHFVARMLQGKAWVLEIGCGDGTGAEVVKPAVGLLCGMDREAQPEDNPSRSFWRADILQRLPHLQGEGILWPWDAIYALDVLEHINPIDEDRALHNISQALAPNGVCIIGMPSKESQPYASPISRAHHVNCKTEDDLRNTLGRHFSNVFMFGMNDATLHTGFGPMCHYRLAVCTGPT